MFFKKGFLVLVVAIILLFGLVSVVLAAPPMQTPEDGSDGSTLGDTIDLDNVKPNLGTIMSGKGSGNDTDDPEGEVPEGETPEGEDPDNELPDGDDPEGEDGVVKEHPVASAMAEFFGVDYDEIMGLHTSGNGFGNIAKAYFFADKMGMTPEEVLTAAHGSGWGNVLKEHGLHPGNGKGPEKEKGTSPGQAKKNGVDELSGQSNGNGNGNNGNGGNGKDKGKGKDKNNK